MRRFLIVSICALSLQVLAGQNLFSQKKPDWVNGFFEERNNSYVEVVSSDGYDLESARNKAAALAIERRSLTTGKRVEVSVQNSTVKIKGNDKLEVKSRIIDEFVEHVEPGIFRVYLLIQTAKNPSLDYEPVKVSCDYPFSPRVFVPGMAQLHKGNKSKGVCFIVGEIAFIGGAVFAENRRSTFDNKVTSTHDASLKKNYINKVNIYSNVRNMAIAGTVALYAWNVIDGIVAKGKKHVMIGEVGVNFLPCATPDFGGLAIHIDF